MTIPRPKTGAVEILEIPDEKQRRIHDLVQQLLKGVPADYAARTAEQNGQQLLADLLDWHRRESNVAWWEFFRLRDLTEEELLDERTAIAGLKLAERLSTVRGISTDRYEFEKQEAEIRIDEELCHKGEKVGEVVAIDLSARTIDIKKTKKTNQMHPSSVFVKSTGPDSKVLAESLIRLADWIIFDGIDAGGTLRAARDLLLRRPPRTGSSTGIRVLESESTLEAAKRVVGSLQESVLPIQGPPGSGKTFTGASMILELIKKGKRVGVTGTSHSVIRNLLEEVVKTASRENFQGLTCLQRVPENPEAPISGIDTTLKNSEARAALRGIRPLVRISPP